MDTDGALRRTDEAAPRRIMRRRVPKFRPFNAGFGPAGITTHPCGAKRHPRSSVLSIAGASHAASIQ
jgi:hypothetical protein